MTTNKLIAAGGITGALVALGVIVWRVLTTDRVIKDTPPDALPQVPSQGRTGFKRIDAILDKLRASAQSTGIPLGLMIGWIARESLGKLAEHPQPGPGDTSMGERGYYQLTPAESKELKLDHERLSTDSDYSLDAGVKLIRHYQSAVNNLDLVPAGNSYYWKLVKLAHSTGPGQMRKIVKAAQAAGQAGSWDQLAQFATGMRINGPQPKKWFPFVDDSRAHIKDSSVYRIGAPFGFGSEAPTVAGLPPRRESSGLDLLGAEAA